MRACMQRSYPRHRHSQQRRQHHAHITILNMAARGVTYPKESNQNKNKIQRRATTCAASARNRFFGSGSEVHMRAQLQEGSKAAGGEQE